MDKVYRDRDWLQEHYLNQGLTARECARLAGCGRSSIYRALKRHGISARTLSDVMRARWAHGDFDRLFTKEYRQKQSDAMKAARARGCFDDVDYSNITEETRRKRSDIMKARWAHGDYDGIFTEEYRQKISDAVKASWAHGAFDNRVFTEETRQKMSDAARARHARGDYDGVFQSPTSIEIAISEALDKLGLMHVKQYRPAGCSFTYDEYLLAEGILLEVNGDYWHTKEGVPERDAIKAAWAREHGFIPMTIWESEIKERGALAMILSIIKQGR